MGECNRSVTKLPLPRRVRGPAVDSSLASCLPTAVQLLAPYAVRIRLIMPSGERFERAAAGLSTGHPSWPGTHFFALTRVTSSPASRIPGKQSCVASAPNRADRDERDNRAPPVVQVESWDTAGTLNVACDP